MEALRDGLMSRNVTFETLRNGDGRPGGGVDGGYEMKVDVEVLRDRMLLTYHQHTHH